MFRVLLCAVTLATLIPGPLIPQACHYVHPPAPPEASQFSQPPNDTRVKFVGPVIRQLNVACWYAEPGAPEKCIGGVHGFQRVQSFLPTDGIVKPEAIDTSFRQKSPLPFSAGGGTAEINNEDLPPGLFISLKGHPVFKVTKVEFPLKAHDPPLAFNGPPVTGASVELEFSHEPSNGECYLYIAVWVAVKDH